MIKVSYSLAPERQTISISEAECFKRTLSFAAQIIEGKFGAYGTDGWHSAVTVLFIYIQEADDEFMREISRRAHKNGSDGELVSVEDGGYFFVFKMRALRAVWRTQPNEEWKSWLL